MGWLMWLRKEGIEVGGRDLSLIRFYYNLLLQVTGRDLGSCKWTPLQMNELRGRGCGMRRGGSHFESSLGLKKCCCVTWVWNGHRKTQKDGSEKKGCYWGMLKAKFILCSAGCIITPALNNHVWVESLNGLVALHKAGKEATPPAPLLRLTGLPLIVWSRLINSGASHKLHMAQCASDVCQHTKI